MKTNCNLQQKLGYGTQCTKVTSKYQTSVSKVYVTVYRLTLPGIAPSEKRGNSWPQMVKYGIFEATF